MAIARPVTVLDITKGLGYGLLYQPMIGLKKTPSQDPFAIPSCLFTYRQRLHRLSK